jgi:hypothetical protein
MDGVVILVDVFGMSSYKGAAVDLERPLLVAREGDLPP